MSPRILSQALESSFGPLSSRASSPVCIETSPSAVNGIRTLPTLKTSLTSMVVARAVARVRTIASAAIPTNMAIGQPKGAKENKTKGKINVKAKYVPKEGNRRSLKVGVFTPIDYAHGMNFEVLLLSEPGFEPVYAKPGDAGADLKSTEAVNIPAGERALVKTGVRIAMPEGYVGLVHPRSGLAAKHGITVLNAPGTVDAGYRGEIMVTLLNTSSEDFAIERGDRIAQLVFQRFEKAEFIAVRELPESSRGETGFGSSGRA
jgi:dUTP pyrophosphatase